MSDSLGKSGASLTSEDSFRALIEQSPDGIIVHRAGVTVYANSAAAKLQGCASPEELVGTNVIELVHPDDRARVRERIAAVYADRPTLPFTDERLVRKDGSSYLASVGAVQVVFEGQRAVVAIARDVTEQRQLQTQLAQSERMASLGVLAAGVAHEINNPLGYLMLRLEAMTHSVARLRRESDRVRQELAAQMGVGAADAVLGYELASGIADELAAHLATASEGAHRVRQIVKDLRSFSRADDDSRLPIDIVEPLELAVSMAAHELGPRAELIREYSPVPPVLANEGRVAQVFLNLLLNAAHAIPEGHRDTNRVTLRTQSREGDVLVSVTDTGSGIPTDVLPRLFEPFFTTKPAGVGSGLGLAICHGIVKNIGGKISVETRDGCGTTFTVSFPTAPSAS